MTERDSFADRARGLEEEYFRKKEQELIEKLRLSAQATSERRAIGDAIGVTDEKVLDNLLELGYTRDTVALLHLVPLVQVAWAEGNVSKAERALIMEAAAARGVTKGSAAHKKLVEWLERRPSDSFFQKTLAIIQAILGALPEDKQEGSKRDLVAYCTRIAEASGGILGLGSKIHDAENALLRKIAASLEASHKSAAKQVLE